MNCEGYTKLLQAVELDEKKSPRFHNYREKLQWAIDRSKQYSDKTGLKAEDILDAWEKNRTYWYMNYYQDANIPSITSGRVRVFDTVEQLQNSAGKEFRCPCCNGVSKDAYQCDSGKEISPGKICDWKVYGLFRDLGKGVSVFVKEKVAVQTIFMPIAWEAAA